jgi:hypothetical protein
MKTTLKNQLEAFDRGVFLDSDGKESWCYNFYDWFCKDKSLERKSVALFKKVKKFMSNYPELDQEKLYVFFKNNCPMVGSLYDDFRICDIETGNVVFTVVPKCSHSGKAEIWGKANDWKGAIKVADNFTGLFK